MRTVVAFVVASLTFAHAGELHKVPRVCDADRMRGLLSSHPSLNETDEHGMTPLHVAIEARQTTCVRLLLEAGADRMVRDGLGRTAMDAALPPPANLTDEQAMKEWRAIVLLLWNTGRQKPETPAGPMPWSLEYTVMHRQADVTNMLLALSVDPNAVGSRGTTPLADAALKGDLQTVRALLAHGARVDAISEAGTQPIHDAALGDSAEVIRELAAHGADINARTRDEGQTPLHVAAAMGKMKAVKALVALGADLTIKDSQGRTPVEVAVREGLTDVAAFLKHAAVGK